MAHGFYEFFAGGGMARLGLGDGWTCLMANDICAKKAATYEANFGGGEMLCKDVYELTSHDMPGQPELAWASFPCQDLSLAGNRDGLKGERSGSFWGFHTAILRLKAERRAPSILVLENVCGALTSHGGKDFAEICGALHSLGYSFGAIVADAVHFLPQSRPRLFIVCVGPGRHVPSTIVFSEPVSPWHPPSMQNAVASLPRHIASKWLWFRLPPPPERQIRLDDLIESPLNDWHSPQETKGLVSMMSPVNREKLKVAKARKGRAVGAVYKRTRVENGERQQRAEVRFDGIAGCLRTPGGGSSRQTLMVVENGEVRTRLLTVREAARLMGVPEAYRIPMNYNDGYHIFGDGLAVPVVSFIREHLLDRIAPAKNLNAIAAE